MLKRLCLILILGCLCARPVGAQLAITEAMSSASTNLGTQLLPANPDWWELTNFGTNDVDLTGYRWNDNQGGLLAGDPTPFAGLIIAAGESIIFVESNATTIATSQQFLDWWGPGAPANLKVTLYSGNGLSSTGDGVRLWGPGAANDGDVIDSVDFLAGEPRGFSFTYDPLTGVFGSFSTNGVGGAFKAATRDDIGSPGFTTGPVPLAITRQPTNTSVNPGDTAVFSVVVRGLPRPAFQWRFNGADIEGARFSTLSVSNVQAANLGQYSVVLQNGFDTLTSSNATLALNAAPEPPVFTLLPGDKNVFIDQSVTFTAMASGVPEPAYQWYFEESAIGGAVSASYSIPAASPANAGSYKVVAANTQGSVTGAVNLIVTRRPLLKITEVMSVPSTNGPFRGHNDWWELTNFDDFTVSLRGYRFDDSSAMIVFAVTITNDVSIAPGESVIFVEGMTPEAFRSWWGSANLPPGLQIISYSGGGLGLSTLGDAVNLWNSGAKDDFDTIASEVFSTGTSGVSFGYNPDTSVFGDLSENGIHGAWSAPENRDIGSPGSIRNPPNPRILQFTRQAAGFSFQWTAEIGRTYSVRFKNGLQETTWTPVTSVVATGPFASASVADSLAESQRVYTITLEP